MTQLCPAYDMDNACKEMTVTEALNQLGAIIDNLSYCGVLEDEEEETLSKIEIVLANYVKSKGDM